MLLAVALVGIALFALAATPILQGMAKSEVLQDSRIMMESAAGVRQYTSAQVAPLLEPRMGQTFHPQAVSAYAATKTFDVLHATFSDYSYREPALNPTNPADQATDWEADIINGFRDDPKLQETSLVRQTPTGDALVLARPLVATQACLVCHSTPAAAPKSMIAIYGPDHGFGWQVNEVIGAQVVSVPMAVPEGMANQALLWFLLIYAGVFAMLFVLMNVLLHLVVLTPINRMAKTAEAVSLGKLDSAEYVREGKDQIARLSTAINRMRRSLQEALRMLSGE
jgi:protein-histidine pros-kinase